jgi:membrane protein required for colicin V production
MNLLDLIIVVTMVFLVIRGVLRGFFREVGSLAGVILGIWLAAVYHPVMTEYLKARLPSFDATTLQLISFAMIFAMVLLICNLAGWGFMVLMRKTLFGWADRGLGAALAVVKGIILTYLVIVLLTFFLPSKTPLIATSRLAPIVISSYQSMARVVSPETYREWKRRFLDGGMENLVPDGGPGAKGKDGSH